VKTKASKTSQHFLRAMSEEYNSQNYRSMVKATSLPVPISRFILSFLLGGFCRLALLTLTMVPRLSL